MAVKEKDEALTDEARAAVEALLVPPTIFERMCAIVAEMPAIGKGQRNEQQGFMYRGHDDVMNELNPLLSKHGVFFAPKVLERITDQRQTSSGKAMYEVNLLVEYTFYGADGGSVKASAWGEGTDMGDKSTNKAMTMALKNVLAQTFAVSTQELSHDTDGDTPEQTTGRYTERETRQERPRSWAEWMARTEAVDPDGGWMVWLDQAAQAVYQQKLAELPAQVRKTEMIQQANASLMALLTMLDGRDMPPPSRAEIAAAFAVGFGGVSLAGPPWRLGPEDSAEEFPMTKAEYDEAANQETS